MRRTSNDRRTRKSNKKIFGRKELKTNVQNDKKLRISVAQNRKSMKWFTEELNWSDFVVRISKPVRTTETYEQFIRMKKSQQDELKDVGRFCCRRVKRWP